MNFFIQRSELRDLYEKVVAGKRISEADALRALLAVLAARPMGSVSE